MASSIHEEKAASAVELDHASPSKELSMAQQSAEEEHNLSLREAIRRYPRAVFWSVLVSTSIIMEGYDIVLIGSFYASPAFRRYYGEFLERTGTYEITAAWQAGLSNAVSVGTILGAFANGHFTQKFGYRKVLLTSLAAICAFIFISFFSPNLPVLLMGQFLCGIPWGVFATMAPAYASEVCPMALRGYLSVYVNLCWALGQLISAGVQAGFVSNTTQWAYRIPFAIQWAWPLPLFLILWFAPESPWHYVRTGQYQQAEQSVRRLSSALQQARVKETVAMMIHTNELEKAMDEGTSYLDC
jgi:SP family general alpha glucoside:H+ symporter-like MFS transporter